VTSSRPRASPEIPVGSAAIAGGCRRCWSEDEVGSAEAISLNKVFLKRSKKESYFARPSDVASFGKFRYSADRERPFVCSSVHPY